MDRLARSEVFAPDEIAAIHLLARTVRGCFLFGLDPLTGKNYGPVTTSEFDLNPIHHDPVKLKEIRSRLSEFLGGCGSVASNSRVFLGGLGNAGALPGLS